MSDIGSPADILRAAAYLTGAGGLGRNKRMMDEALQMLGVGDA